MNTNLHSKKAKFRLLKYAFHFAGYKSMEITHCRKLSFDIMAKLGRTVSPITLFRMSNPEKYDIQPYGNTLNILLNFCGLNSIDEIPDIIEYRKQPVLLESLSDLQVEPLGIMIDLLLEKRDKKLIFDFLDRLPDQSGIMQTPVSHAFANHFRNLSNPLQAISLFKTLSVHPNFQRYFTLAFPDFDFMDGYFYSSLEELIREKKLDKSIKLSLSEPDSWNLNTLEKDVFHLTVFIWMAFIKGQHTEIRHLGGKLFSSIELHNQIKGRIQSIPILHVRYLTARYIYAFSQGIESMARQTWLELEETINENFIHNSRLLHVNGFISVMTCDMLTLTGQSTDKIAYRLQDKKITDYALVNHYEPAMLRYVAYNSPQPEKRFTSQSPDMNFCYGFYEYHFSNQLLLMQGRIRNSI